MAGEDITKFVISELGKHHRPNDIVKAICEKTGMKWDEAEQFLNRIQVEYSDEIAKRQNVLLVVIGVATTLVGFALALSILVATLNGLVIFLFQLPVPYLGNVIYFGTGIAMAAGGIMGLARLKGTK